MGMFTQLSHNGSIYQFKTGFDDLRIYRVGDTIPWEPDPRYPGEHIDGVHAACDSNGDDRLWVIIKDCRIASVCKIHAGDNAETVADLCGLRPPPRELWSELAWAEKAARDAQSELAYQRYLAENPEGNPHDLYARSLLKQQSFAQQILPAMKEPQHTPGPWHARGTLSLRSTDKPGPWVVEAFNDGRSVPVATVGGLRGTPVDEANARLIAAAPELLEQLVRLVNTFDPDKQAIYEHARPLIERSRATIKKARGE